MRVSTIAFSLFSMLGPLPLFAQDAPKCPLGDGCLQISATRMPEYMETVENRVRGFNTFATGIVKSKNRIKFSSSIEKSRQSAIRVHISTTTTDHRALTLLCEEPTRFVGQGTIVETWRTYRGPPFQRNSNIAKSFLPPRDQREQAISARAVARTR